MTADKTYNGWTNYETWNVKLWMDNDEGSYLASEEAAQEAWADTDPDETTEERTEEAVRTLADRLKDEHEEAKDALLDGAKASSTVWADLLGAALSEVNWHEIAASMIEDVDKSE